MNVTVNKLVEALRPYFLVSRGNNTVGGTVSPDVAGTRDLGTIEKPFRRVYALELVGGSVILDDQPNYVHISSPRTITARHTFAPTTSASPFILGANAYGETVVGLKADQLNKSVLAGNGMSGGGALTANVTITLATPASVTSTSTNSVAASSHTHAIDSTIARSAITLAAGDGISGGGDLTANRTFAVELSAVSGLELDGTSPGKTLQIADSVAGDGIAISGKVMSVGAANTIQSSAGAGLSVESNGVRLTAGYSPGAATSILASDATGKLTLPLLETTTSIKTPLLTTASGDLTIDPVGVVKFPVAQTLTTTNFDSDFPILGWQINEVIGVTGQSALTIGKIAADELSVKVFVADETRVDRANQYWTKSYGIVAETFTTPLAIGGTVTVKFEDSPALAGAIFTVNDWLLFRIIDMTSGLEVANAWGQVSNYLALPEDPELGVTLQSWTFTLRSGATSTVIKKGRTAVDFGASGAALIHLSVLDSAGAPYIKMRKWAGADPYTPANFTTYVQIGELASVNNALLPYAPSGYGLYVRSGEGQAILADSTGLLIQGADFRMYNGANQTVNISSTGESFWVGLSASDKRLHWDGTTLAISGTVTANLGAIGGWTIATSGLTATNIGLYSGAANTARVQVGSGSDIAGINSTAAGTDIAFWAGDTHANRASAEFRVRADGQLYATGATLSGAITATSGTITGDFSVTSGGKLTASGGGIVLTATGINIGSYPNVATGGTPPDNSKSLTWWGDASAQTGLLARMFASYDISPDNGAYWEIDVAPGTTSLLGSPGMFIWQANANFLWLKNITSVVGLPGIGMSKSGTAPITATVQVDANAAFWLNASSEFKAWTHLQTGTASTYDIGTSGAPWRKIYVDEVVATTITGSTALAGNTWQRADAGDMYIKSYTDATSRTLYVSNSGTGSMHLDVEGNITLTGTVDGVDISDHVANTNAHHARSHDITSTSDHTATGLTAGWVLRASAATTFAWAQLAHGDLSGVTADQHHAQSHSYDSADHTGSLSWSKVSKTGSNLNEIATRSHTVLSDIGTNTHAAIDTHIGTADTHVAHSTVSILGGNGLTGGGAINATQTLHVAVSGLGLSVGTDAVTLSSSSAGEANEHILATNASGGFSVAGNVGIGNTSPSYKLDVSGTGRFTDDLYVDDYLEVDGNLKVGNNVLYVNTAGTRVGINSDASDPQFDLNVGGPVKATYFVGKHAIQLDNAVGVFHFDGAAPYNLDFTGSHASHMGVGGTVTGGVIHRPGKFGKAVQMAEGTTNLLYDPSFESDTLGATIASFYGYTGSNITITASSDYALFGSQSAKLANTGGGNTLTLQYMSGSMAAGSTHTYSFYCRKSDGSQIVSTDFTVQLENGGGGNPIVSPVENGWYRVSATQTIGAASSLIRLYVYYVGTIYIDGMQLEAKAYATPYCDGSLGTGHTWSGTPHASTSTRATSKISYPHIDFTQTWTVMGWVKYDSANNNDKAILTQVDDGGETTNKLLHLVVRGSALHMGFYSNDLSGLSSLSAGIWYHVAFVYNGTHQIIYLNGIVDNSRAASPYLGTTGETTLGAYTSTTSPLNGFIDDLVVLDYAAEADLIRTIYESDAPVFVASSVFHWRSPARVPIWVDEFGLWAQGVNGNAMLGLYGGDPRNPTGNLPRSWGGVDMYEGDLVIGGGSSYVHWDASAAILKVKGEITADSGSIAGALTMGASGSITATNTVMNADGIKINVSSAFANERALRFFNGATFNAGLWSYADANYVQTSLTNNIIAITGTTSAATADRHATLTLDTMASGTRTATLLLTARSKNPTVDELSIIELSSASGTNAGRQIYMYTYALNIEASNGVAISTLEGTGNRTVYSTSTGVLTNSSSDARMKTNITPIDDALALVNALEPVRYRWADAYRDKLGSQQEIGLIAQKVAKFVPEVVGVNPDGMLSLDYPHLVAVLVGAIQQLSKRLDTLTLSKGEICS